MEFFASWVFRCRFWVYLKINYPGLEVVAGSVKKSLEAEKKMENLLKTIGVDYLKQPKGRLDFEEFSILGRADFLTKNCVIEVKNSSKDFPKEWIAQLNLYMRMFGVERGVIARFCGDGVEMRLFRFDENLYDESLEYFAWFLKNKPTPPKTCGKKWCGYRHICTSGKL